MRGLSLAALLLLASPILGSPTPGSKNDCNKTVKPGQSIQKAINSAKPGDKITVEKGTYNEQLTITTSGITLIGKGAILMPPTKFGHNLCSGLNKDFAGKDTEAGICIHGKDVKLADFVKEHKKVISKKDYIRDVVVTGFTVQGFSGENIAVVAGKNVQITHNNLLEGPQYGFLTVGSQSTLAKNNVVTNQALGFIAMCMDDERDSKNVANNVAGYYIAMCTQTNGLVVKDNTITKSCIGVFVDPNIDGAKVIGNKITDRNAFCPTFPEKDNAGAGIIVFGAKNTLVEGNHIANIKNNGTGPGILISDDSIGGVAKATGNKVKRNSISNTDIDIFTDAAAMDTVFAGNKCTTSAPGDYCE